MKHENRRHFRNQLIGLVALLSIVFLLAGYYYYRNEKSVTQERKYNELHAVAHLKANQVTQWIRERQSEANFFSSNYPYSGYARNIINGNRNDESAYRNALLRIMTNDRYEDICLLNEKGDLIFSIVNDSTYLHDGTLHHPGKMFPLQDVTFRDFYFCPVHKEPHLEMLAPVRDEQKEFIGMLLFRINPNSFLYPLMQEWPMSGESSESYLVREENDSVRFISPLKFTDNSSIQTIIPQSMSDRSAVRAVMKEDGMFLGKDYIGQKIMAEIVSVTATPWYLIVEMNTSELFAELNKRAILIAIITLLSIFFAGMTVAWIYYSRQRNMFRELLRKESELHQSKEEFVATLYSIADGVIKTDTGGIVRQMNPVAEKLTGWKEEEAVGRSIEEVFQILDEDTRERLANPVYRVLQERKTVTSENHLLLLSRNSSETAVNSSGSPIKDNVGNLLGVVMIFSDQSASRLRRKMIEIRLRLLEYAVNHSLSETLRKMLDEIGILINSPGGVIDLLKDDQTTPWLQVWSTETVSKYGLELAEEKHRHLSASGVWDEIIKTKTPVIVSSGSVTDGNEMLSQYGIDAICGLVVPVFRNQRLVAVVGLGRKPSGYTEPEIETASYLADVAWELTERKLREQRLQESEEKYRRIAENISDVVWTSDLNFNFTYVSPSYERLFGGKMEDEVRKPMSEKYPPESLKKLYRIFQEELDLENDPTADKNRSRQIEIEHYHANGGTIWLGVNASFFRDENGKAIGFQGVSRDITNRKKAEEALRLSEEKMRSIFRVAPTGIGVVVDRVLTEVNPRICEMTGYSKEELIGQNSRIFYQSDEDYDYVGSEKYRQIAVQGTGIVETRWKRKDGSIINILLASTPIDTADLSRGVTFTALDITERIVAEKALRESEERYRLILNTSNDAIFLAKPDGTILSANKAACEMFGMTEEEMCAVGRAGLVDPEDTRIEALLEMRRKEGRYKGELTHIRKNGTKFHTELSSSSFYDSNGNPLTSVIIRDITPRKTMEKQLRESEETIRLLFNSTAEGIYGIDIKGNCTFCNRAALNLLGYIEESEVIGKNMHDLIHHTHNDGAHFQEDTCHIYQAFKTGSGTHVDNEVLWKKDGTSFPAEYWSYPIHREGGVIGAVVTFMDITERTKMIEDLVAAKVKAEESDRLKSAFLANVSHEIRTPMNGILGFMELMGEPGISEEQRALYLDIMNKSGQRLLATINDIVEIAKIEAGQVEVHFSEVDLEKEMQFHFDFFGRQAAEKKIALRLESQIKGDDSKVLTDRHKLNGILTNLLNNAVKFTGKGEIVFGNYLRDDQMVFFVKDTGIGIPASKHNAIFDRFVQADLSISRAHEGSGLGLSIVKAYLDKLNGEIWLESEKDKGTTFWFSLPWKQVNNPGDPRFNQVSIKSPLPGDITILVAEDDEIGFKYLEAILRKESFRLIRTVNGRDTVRVVQENSHISLVLMDFRMPDISGLDATRLIREFNQEIPIIAQTAYAFAGDRSKALAAGCNDYISKPIDKEALIAMIGKYAKSGRER